MKRQPELKAADSSIAHSPVGPKRGGFLPTAMLAIAGVSGSVTACFEQGKQDDPAAVEVQRKSLEAQSSAVQGVGETLAESFLRTSDGLELACLVKNDPDLPDPIRGINEGFPEFRIRDAAGNFVIIPVRGLEDLRVPIGQKITAIERVNGGLEIFIENFGGMDRYQGSIVDGVLNIQLHPSGTRILNPDDPEDDFNATYSQAIPEGVVTVHARRVYFLNNRGDDPQFLGELTNEEDDRLTEIGDLPDLSASGYTIFLDDFSDPITGLREVRINLSQGTILERLKAGLGSGDADSEPVRVGGRNKEALWVQVGDGNEVYIGRPNGVVERLTLDLDPIIPPVDAAVQDAAPQDAGVDASAEQDAATPDAGSVDAEVSPADSEVDAAVTDAAAPADMSVSPDMAESDAEPDGGMVQPDQGLDMEADSGVELDQGEPIFRPFAPDCDPEKTVESLDGLEDYFQELDLQAVPSGRFCETTDGLLRIELDPSQGRKQTMEVEMLDGATFKLTFVLKEGAAPFSILLKHDDSSVNPITSPAEEVGVDENGVNVQTAVGIGELQAPLVLVQAFSDRLHSIRTSSDGRRELVVAGFDGQSPVHGAGIMTYDYEGTSIIFEIKDGEVNVFPIDEIIETIEGGIPKTPDLQPEDPKAVKIVGGASLFSDCSTIPGNNIPADFPWQILVGIGGVYLVRRRKQSSYFVCSNQKCPLNQRGHFFVFIYLVLNLEFH